MNERPQAGEMAFALISFWLRCERLPLLQDVAVTRKGNLPSSIHLSKFNR